jgi:NodT family efflux transporter outer membrane factor (OMF) lipoprotein
MGRVQILPWSMRCREQVQLESMSSYMGYAVDGLEVFWSGLMKRFEQSAAPGLAPIGNSRDRYVRGTSMFMPVVFRALAMSLFLVLAGCVSSGGLHPSATLVEPTSLNADQSLAAARISPAAWPTQDWWSGLGDPQLDALIAEALKDNPDLVAADARARAAQAEAGVADAARGPSVDAAAGVSGQRIPAGAPMGTGHFGVTKYASVGFDWGLDLWGGKRAVWEAAIGQARATEIDAHAARIELSVNVARAYVRLSHAWVRLDVAKQERARAAQASALTRQRVAAGIDSQVQLKQGDAEVATADGQILLAERAIDATRSALSVLLGKGPDRGLTIARPRGLPEWNLGVPGDLPVELLGHRADLVAARWRVDAASQGIKAAKAEFLPNISISALAGVIGVGGGNPFVLPSRFYQVAPSLSLPLFDGGRLRSNLAGKDAHYDLAVAQYNRVLIAAVNQVSDDYAAQQSLIDQVAAEDRARDAAGQAWELAHQRYQAGVGSYLEALVVRQQLLVSEQRLAALKASQVDLSIRLIQDLGGGYRPDISEHVPVATQSVPPTSTRY